MDRTFRNAAVLLISASVIIATASCGGGSDSPPPTAGETLAEGRQLYEETCAACHGLDLKGTQAGPPFLSPIYAPNHHPDAAFFAAAADGVQPHHWDFGPMPPLPNVSREEVEAIVTYIRARQVEAGITEDPSHP